MKKRKAFTLVELLLTLALISVVILIGTNMFIVGNKAQSLALDEFDIQSNTRLISEYINQITRSATKAHTIPKSSFQYSELGVRDPMTSYIGINKDGDVVIDEPGENPGDRIVQTLVKKQEEVEFEIVFDNVLDEDGKEIPNMLKFTIIGSKNGRKVSEIVSSVDVLNSMQVEHLGTPSDPAVALGFTKADAGSQEWIMMSPDAYIVMVLDRSGSMAWDMDGGNRSPSRMSILKDKATNLINRLSEFDFNIYVSIVPFSDNANPTGSGHDFISLKEKKQDALNIINGLTANGATNTGDGIRRAYHKLKDKGDELRNSGKNYNDFTQHMMVLVDGETNRESREITGITGWLIKRVSSEKAAENNNNTNNTLSVGNNRVVSVRENDNTYINHLGNTLVKRNTYEDEGENKQIINTFVIGFSNLTKDHGSLQGIGEALNGKEFMHGSVSKPYIIATNADDLDFAFEQFEAEVENNLWMITRPQLLPND